MRRQRKTDTPEIPIAPMIDCVFLMLVYFMTTSSLEKSEADLACPVVPAGMSVDPLPAVDEQVVQLTGSGELAWNGSVFPLLGEGAGAAGLLERLDGFRRTCQLAGSEPSLQILPEATAPYQALITLLDAVSRSGIEKVRFP